MPELIPIVVVFLIGSVAAWAMTVPLHRFKEFRPKSQRDIEAEVGTADSPPMVIRASYRQAICPRCHHNYSAADVVPIISWFRGCPGCGLRLPATVPVLQLGIPLSFAATAASLHAFVNSWMVVVPFLWLVIVLAAISLVDFRIWLIPYWMPWVGSAAGLVLISVASLAVGEPVAILFALAGAAASFMFFFVLFIAAPGKLGFGDVRLSLLIGLFLAWLHPILPIYGLLFGSLAGLAVGLVSIAARKGRRFSFGPALAFGAMCAIWFAGPILA